MNGQLKLHYEQQWQNRLQNDKDFDRFRSVHSEIRTLIMWKTAVTQTDIVKALHSANFVVNNRDSDSHTL